MNTYIKYTNYILIYLYCSGTIFTELWSDDKTFKLIIETRDEMILGHLVLYHVLEENDDSNNIQLWHSDFSDTTGTGAILKVVYFLTFSLMKLI